MPFRIMRAAMTTAVATALALTVVKGAGQEQEPFRAGTRIVPVLTTVLDAQRRLVPDLEQADFTVLDNGKPVELSVFQNETTPFTVVVMLDTSASMTNNL